MWSLVLSVTIPVTCVPLVLAPTQPAAIKPNILLPSHSLTHSFLFPFPTVATSTQHPTVHLRRTQLCQLRRTPHNHFTSSRLSSPPSPSTTPPTRHVSTRFPNPFYKYPPYPNFPFTHLQSALAISL